MDVGFTGTQGGMTPHQLDTFERVIGELFSPLGRHRFRHGDCIGADADAHSIVKRIYGVRIVIHPPVNPKKRAFCTGAAKVLEPKEYLSRNKDIVDASRILVATPAQDSMEMRSGTWSTVRHALRSKPPRRVMVIFPDGRVDTDFHMT